MIRISLIAFILISCTNNNETQKDVLIENSSMIVEQPTVTSNIGEDIIIDTLEFPLIELTNEAIKYNKAFPGKILTTGHFHKEEVWPNIEDEYWVGIFEDTKGYYISKTKIKVKRVYDPIDDDTNLEMKTGWEIKADNIDTTFLLISGLNYLESHRIETFHFNNVVINPGDSLKIEHKGNTYKFYATGVRMNQSTDNNFYNYKIFLQVKINGIEKTQLLVSNPMNEDALPNIQFIGDIDEDGILDIIMDTTNH